MENYEKVPWLKVHDYLLQVGSCRTIPEFMRTACTEIEKLIPCDAAGFHSTIDARFLDGIGLSDSVMTLYNDYYRTTQPGSLGADGKDWDFGYFLTHDFLDWRKHRDLEFATDFMLPNQMFKSLAHVFPTQQISLSAQRSRLSPDFTDTEVTTLDLLNQHLNNLYKLFDRKCDPPVPSLSTQGIGDRFHSLSQREAELCSLVALRLKTGEIATRLFISPRTVEKHIEDIFGKFDVHSREQLRLKLGIQAAP